ARLRHVRQDRFPVLVEDFGSGGNAQHHVAAVGTGPLTAGAAMSAGRAEVLLVAVVDEGVQIRDALGIDAAAAAAVAAVRPAELDELLAPEADGTAAAVAAADPDLGFIEEAHCALVVMIT